MASHTVQQQRRFCLSIQNPSSLSISLPFSSSSAVTSRSCSGRVKFLMCRDAVATAESSSSSSSSAAS